MESKIDKRLEELKQAYLSVSVIESMDISKFDLIIDSKLVVEKTSKQIFCVFIWDSVKTCEDEVVLHRTAFKVQSKNFRK
jgi:cytidylate kinase